ncbi:MAG: NAD(P)-dependent oxidoreductase [Fervidicoccaceae archaeon]
MRVLVTGAAGFVGLELTKAFLEAGHDVVALDKVEGGLAGLKHPRLSVVLGGVEEHDVVKRAVEGVDVVVHCAWSFAQRALDAFRVDLAGYANVLELSSEAGVKHFMFADSTIAYGRPLWIPVDEQHPLIPYASRAPLYALTRVITLELNELFRRTKGLNYTIFRFWWAFSDERIPGRTLRRLIDRALSGEEIEVPSGAGGSVVYTGDLAKFLLAAALNERVFNEVINVASFYVTWEELVKKLIELAGSPSRVKLVPEEEWRGEAFLTGRWLLDTTRARKLLGVAVDEEARRAKFFEVLSSMVSTRKSELASGRA